MLRITTTRQVLKGIVNVPTIRSSHSVAISTSKSDFTSKIRSLSTKRPRAIAPTASRIATIPLLRYATKARSPIDKIDQRAERRNLEKELEAHPDTVTGTSSLRPIFEESQTKKDDGDADMLRGIRSDIETVKETFALTEVPRESYYLGLAGVLPYLATSLSTVYLAYDINHAHATGSGLLFSPETAHQLLSTLEPIQIGYGAVIISFLGAIHWGLEYAGYGGHHSYRRFAYGVVTPAAAWPTIFMPTEYALISQFLIFNFLYFADARATARGWAPPWYSTYRFVLTFIVGASIVVSLIGRGQIAEHDAPIAGPTKKMKVLRDAQWEALEAEERERQKRMAEEEAEEAVEGQSEG